MICWSTGLNLRNSLKSAKASDRIIWSSRSPAVTVIVAFGSVVRPPIAEFSILGILRCLRAGGGRLCEVRGGQRGLPCGGAKRVRPVGSADSWWRENACGVLTFQEPRAQRDRPHIEFCGFRRPQFRLQRCRRKTRNAVYVLEKIGRGERI